jgi:2,3-bisphosphoglycerate-independent phosphoglycerate mutase
LDYDFTVVNYANGDMVWHTWIMEASVKSVKKLDEIVWKTIKFCDENNIDLLITADHGNCEEMWTIENPKTAHTTNLVPFWYIKNGEVVETKNIWWLANIASTVLKIMWIEKVQGMEKSLF